MLKKIRHNIAGLYFKQIDGRGLSLFRILYAIVLLCEIGNLFYYRHLIFDPVPYIQKSEIDVTLPLLVWMISVVFLAVGAFTRSGAIVNYICSLVFIATINSYEYHMFNIYMGINFLLLFLPVSRQWSLDRLFTKLRYSNTRFQYNPPSTVSSLAYFIPVLLTIGLVYFDSTIYKLNDRIWMSGLGIWLPASLPMVVHHNISWMLNQEFLIKFLSYFTLVFEFIFIFIMWQKRFRWFCFFTGFILHLGILLVFPIPYFALGVCAIYILMIPVGVYRKLDRFRRKEPLLLFYYDNECPLCVRTMITIRHFDVFRAVSFLPVQTEARNQPLFSGLEESRLYEDIYSVAKGKIYCGVDTYIKVFDSIFYLKPVSWILRIPGIYHLAKAVYRKVAGNRVTERCTEETCGYTPPVIPSADKDLKLLNTLTLGELKEKFVFIFFILIIAMQVVVSYNSSLILRGRKLMGIDHTYAGIKLSELSDNVDWIGKSILGITHHALFLEPHFSGYEHIVMVSYCKRAGGEIVLPVISPKGMPDKYVYGFNWCKWSFRVNGPQVNMQKLNDGLRSFTAFWANRNNILLADDSFKVYVKKIHIPLAWERDFLSRYTKNNDWIPAGTVYWKNRQFASQVSNIEEI